MIDEEYEIVEKYLRKKYGNDYVDFIETEGQAYLEGYKQGQKDYVTNDRSYVIETKELSYIEIAKENGKLKERIESYRNAVEKCRHIPYIGVGDEVCRTAVEYAQKVDEILFSVEGIDYWFERLGK